MNDRTRIADDPRRERAEPDPAASDTAGAEADRTVLAGTAPMGSSHVSLEMTVAAPGPAPSGADDRTRVTPAAQLDASAPPAAPDFAGLDADATRIAMPEAATAPDSSFPAPADDAMRIAPAATDATRIAVPESTAAKGSSFAAPADDSTRISPAIGYATGIATPEANAAPAAMFAAPADDATRVAPTTGGASPMAPAGRPDGTGRTTSTESNWAHPERWRGTTDGPMGPGSVLKDRFLLDRLLGQGGMGSVYRALDRRKEEARDSQPYVALKLLNDDFRRHPDALVALQREAKKAQLLAHPNIVTVYDFDRDGTQVFMTMEHLQGDPLDVVIRRSGLGGMPVNKALIVIDRMARGLAYAHKKAIVHSDFKPGNVFLTEDGEAKILDFGIARAARIGTGKEGDRTQFDPTSLGALTPAYASVEMLEGEAPEPADDVYALTCVGYELLTGRHPFLDASGRKLSAAEALKLGLRPAPIPQLPKRIQRALMRGLALRRADRFADAGAFLEAIKPRARLGRTVIAALVVLTLAASVSWYLLIQESDMMITLEGLPASLEAERNLIRDGDRLFEANDIPQAHARFALAWDQAVQREDLASRDRAQLRVIIDRRSDAVADHFIRESQRTDLDEFSLELLQFTLESLARSELGTRRERLERAQQDLRERLRAGR